jgi:tetratricopeptide (TPR) repeat protein
MNLIWQRRSTIWGLRFLICVVMEAAVEAYQQALAIYNRHDIPDEKARTLGNLGRLYLSERRYEDALPYLREAADLVERLRAEGLRPRTPPPDFGRTSCTSMRTCSSA